MTNPDDATAEALETFLTHMQKDKNKAVFALGDDTVARVQAIPTGALSLDVALGVGGIPRGRISELYGPESSGKTSLTLAIAANAQKMGLNVGFVDAEHALDRGHAEAYGVDIDRMAFYQPDHGEDALQMAVDMAESGAFGLVIVDSVAALTPLAELEGSMEQNHVGLQARMMGQGMRKLSGAAQKSGTAVVFINQLREKIGVMMGNPETTPGGRALKFFCSVRMDIRSAMGDRITASGKKTDDPIGQTCRVKIVKNKVAPPMRRGEFKIFYETGIDRASGIIEAGKQLGVIYTKGASYYRMGDDERLAIGAANFEELLNEDTDLADELTAQIYGVLRGEVVDPADEDAAVEDASDETADETADEAA